MKKLSEILLRLIVAPVVIILGVLCTIEWIFIGNKVFKYGSLTFLTRKNLIDL